MGKFLGYPRYPSPSRPLKGYRERRAESPGMLPPGGGRERLDKKSAEEEANKRTIHR